jgi:hypothetical protein
MARLEIELRTGSEYKTDLNDPKNGFPYDQNIPDRWECRFYDEISG